MASESVNGNNPARGALAHHRKNCLPAAHPSNEPVRWDDLLVQQVRHAQTLRVAADSEVTVRLPEADQWLLVPAQATPQAAVTWDAIWLSGRGVHRSRTSRVLRADDVAAPVILQSAQDANGATVAFRAEKQRLTQRQVVGDLLLVHQHNARTLLREPLR
jgi:hypothetical protein